MSLRDERLRVRYTRKDLKMDGNPEEFYYGKIMVNQMNTLLEGKISVSVKFYQRQGVTTLERETFQLKASEVQGHLVNPLEHH